MRSERGQGTIEYVGVLLLVAALLGALVLAFGRPAGSLGVAGAFVRAVGGAFGLERKVAPAAVSIDPVDRALFARAVDAGVAIDDRPSLRDVRLALIARYGDTPGRSAFRALVLDDLRATVPGLGGGTRFGTLDGPALVIGTDMDRSVARARALAQPANGDSGEIESPTGSPNVHVVTAGEQDEAFRAALHPDVSWTSLALDGVSAIPLLGTAMGVERVAVAGGKLAAGVATAAADLGDADDVIASLSPSAKAIPPGTREGDEIVTWTASRRAARSGARRIVERSAVVRDGVVLAAGIRLPT